METEVMDTTVAVQELTEKVLRLEQEVAGLRQLEQEVVGLRQEVGELKNKPATNGQAAITDHLADKEKVELRPEAGQKADSIAGIRWADQEALSRAMRELFAALDIQGEPIGAENLQRMMEHSGLEKDELSRSLIEARDE